MHEFESPLKPELAEITRVKTETGSLKTFTVSFSDKKIQKKFCRDLFIDILQRGFKTRNYAYRV